MIPIFNFIQDILKAHFKIMRLELQYKVWIIGLKNMTYCMVFVKAGGRGIVWRYLQRMYGPLLKENSRRWQHSLIYRAYETVLIDILCDNLREKYVPLQVVRFLFRLLWRKVLVFFAGGRGFMTLVGYKGLPQGLVLSPFL
jgi:hypothetical protein